MPRPVAAPTIPSELTDLRQWVAWRLINREGKDTKVPIGRHGSPVSVTDEQEWMSFNEAKSVPNTAGVGFVFSASGAYTGVDLDACRHKEAGTFTTEALDILEKLASYSEISPSGTGVKIILRARMAEGSRHKINAPWKATTADKHAHIECYDRGRFFTITGDVLPGCGTVTATGASFINELMRPQTEAKADPQAGANVPVMSDAELVDVARLFPSTSSIMANLYVDSRREAYGADESRCDYALCLALARHTDNATQLERIFRASRLYATKEAKSLAKWDRPDYVQRTVVGAIDEKKDERAKDLGLNYRTVRRVKQDELEEYQLPLTVLETTLRMGTFTKGELFNVGEACYLASETKGEEPTLVSAHEELTAMIGHRNNMCIRWKMGTGFTTRGEGFAALRQMAPNYHSIETVPTHPAWPSTYYNCPDLPSPDGAAFEAWLDLFNWATPEDRLLGASLFMTPFWGGPGGQRPLFAVSSPDGQQSGKTTLVQMAARLLGQIPIVPQTERNRSQDGIDVTDLLKRMLSKEGRKSRVVLLDNVTGKINNSDLAALITGHEISGRQLHEGEGTRPNTVTYCMTLNAPSLDTDFATRSMELRIKRPAAGYSDWQEQVSRFLGEHRWAVIAHILDRLKKVSPTIVVPEAARQVRFPLWMRQVLGAYATVDGMAQVATRVFERREEHNTDMEEAEVFAFALQKAALRAIQTKHLKGELAGLSAWIYNPVVANIFGEALNRRNASVPTTIRHITSLHQRGDFAKWPIRFGVRQRVDGQQLTGVVVGCGEPVVFVQDPNCG